MDASDVRGPHRRPPDSMPSATHPAIGTSRRHGRWPLRPLVGYHVQWWGCGRPLRPAVKVAVSQPSATPSAGHKIIAKPLQNQAVHQCRPPADDQLGCSSGRADASGRRLSDVIFPKNVQSDNPIPKRNVSQKHYHFLNH
jgi:hypothetical protein